MLPGKSLGLEIILLLQLVDKVPPLNSAECGHEEKFHSKFLVLVASQLPSPTRICKPSFFEVGSAPKIPLTSRYHLTAAVSYKSPNGKFGRYHTNVVTPIAIPASNTKPIKFSNTAHR